MVTLRSFPERQSKFLRSRLQDLAGRYGTDSARYRGLALQYVRDSREDEEAEEANVKHYEAELGQGTGEKHSGMERLYRRVVVIEPTTACAAYCRYCLRSNYGRYTLTEPQLVDIARRCGSTELADVREVLITGGDPLVIPKRIEVLLEALIEHAPNVRVARIATRVPTQDPDRIDDDVLRLFKNKPSLRFELATQVNHPVELEAGESMAAYQRIQDLGVKTYAQNVLLKGVNDDVATLVDLYDAIRAANMESHYLFHAVPLKGTRHLRTTLSRGLRLAASLTSCGAISGRAKPMYAAMTDIGKITLYEGTILETRNRHVLLQSRYVADERRRWNPSWQMPSTAVVDTDGCMRVWYLDGDD